MKKITTNLLAIIFLACLFFTACMQEDVVPEMNLDQQVVKEGTLNASYVTDAEKEDSVTGPRTNH